MELKKINWKAIAVLVLTAFFMFSVFQSATFASNSMNNNVPSHIPLSSGNFVKISAGSIFENSFVKANGPAVQNIGNNAGYVKYTLDLANNQLINGNYLNSNQSKIEPFGVSYDSNNGNLYVADFGTNNTTVIDGSNNSIIKTIPVSDAPTGIAVNSSSGNVYVTSYEYFGNVSLINGTTNTVVKTIPVGNGSDAIAFDSFNGYVYVANTLSQNVSIINGTTNTVVKSIPVGNGPEGIAFDQSNGYVYVANYASSNVSVINGNTNTVVKTIPVGIDPQAVAFDSSNGNLYVTDAYSGMVSIISTTPISEYTVTFKESGLPTSTSWAVDLNGTLKSSTNSTISFLEPNGTYGFNVQPIAGYSVTPQSGNVIVDNSNTSYSITFSQTSTQPPVWAFVGAYANYSLTMVYKGTSINVNLTERAIAVNINNDTVELQQIVTTKTSSNIQNTTIYDNWNNFNIWLGRGLISQLNNGSFNGLSQGFNSSNISTSVKVITPAGTFLTDEIYGVQSGMTLNLYFEMYSGILVNEHMTNSTGSFNAVLTSTNIPEGNSALSNYNTTFTESGLPAGTAWYVNLSNGMDSGSITGSFYTFQLPNGTYSYNIATTDKIYHSNAGTIKVNAKNSSFQASFTKYTYKVSFTESGLPSGTHWNMTFNGATSGSNGTTITFNAVNGTYSYTVSNISGYSVSSGSVSVNGANIEKNITFSTSPTPGLPQTELYGITGAIVAVIAVVGLVAFFRRK